ncbi:MAG: hypothetical protein ACRDL7_07380, partial [Gaiellaceae bacterium]
MGKATANMPALTRKQAEEAFEHLFANVLELEDTDPLRRALAEKEYDSILDIAWLSEDGVNGLKFVDRHGESVLVPEKKRKMLLHVLWWRTIEAAKRDDHYVDWFGLTPEGFTKFRQTIAPEIVMGNISKPGDATKRGSTTSRKAKKFNTNIKLDVGQYPKFEGLADD